MIRVSCFFFLLLTGPALASWGQAPASTTALTLPQALTLARTNYPALRARQAGIAAAAADPPEGRAGTVGSWSPHLRTHP